MSSIKKGLLAILFIFIVVPYAGGEDYNMSPLGFQFGISKKDAMRVIDAKGKRIIEDNKDSKEIITIIMQGVIVDLPMDLAGRDVRTGLEFYDKKLWTTALILISKDVLEQSELQDMVLNYLTEKYGQPDEKDSMLYFSTWGWDLPETKMILHTNNKDNTLKVEFTNKVVHSAKMEDEIDIRRGTVHGDPASEMFLDGDYSKPTGYDTQYDR